MKRVLVLNQFALPSTEAGGTRHSELFSRLNGWKRLIIAGRRNHYTQSEFSTDEQGFMTIPVPVAGSGMKSRLRAWCAYLIGAGVAGVRAGRADVVYASTPHLLVPFLGWAFARLWRAPLVVEVRDLWPESFVSMGLVTLNSPVHRFLKMVERVAVGLADHIVVVTAGWEEHFRELGVPVGRITVIPNGASPRPLDSGAFRRFRDELELIPRPRGVFAGAHGPKDGLDSIVDSARLMPNVSFVLVGGGTEKERLMHLVKEGELGNVYFLDPIPKEQLYEFLACFDFGIHTVASIDVFRKGMSPNKLFDYMAAGLPVASNGGPALDAVLEGVEVGVVTDGDLPAAVSSVCDATEVQYRDWRDAASTLLGEKFGRDAVAGKLERVLDGVSRR